MGSKIINTLKIYLADISLFRSEIMGWSIIGIMMLHFRFISITPLGFLAQYGFTGVDIFIFVSGFGLFYSLEKDHHILRFYKKRLLRIFPTYYIIGFVSSLLIEHDDILTFLYRYTTIGFWTDGPYSTWYIPSIVLLYLLAPFIKHIYQPKYLYIVAILVAILWGASYYFVDKEYFLDRSHFFLLYRVPAFLFGMLCAYWLKRGIDATKYYYLIMLAGIPIFAILLPHHHEYYNYKYFALTFLFPLFVYFICILSRWTKLINPLISEIGKASLEIFLIQHIFFSAIINETLNISDRWHDICTIGLIILCSLLGIGFHWLLDHIGINRLFQVSNNKNGKA